MDAHDQTTTAQLDRIVERHPELAPLRALIPDDLEITPAFHAAYHASTVGYATRSLLLRQLTGDKTLLAAGTCTEGMLRRVLSWMALEGVLSGQGTRDQIPKGFSTLTGVDRSNITDFVAEAFLRPWWQVHTGVQATLPAYFDIPSARLLELLAPLAEARMLTLASADAWLRTEDLDRTHKLARWYFDTGVPAIDLANALTLTASLLDGDRQGGRIQNRLPVALTDRWHIARLSIPEATAFADVATMAMDNVLALPDDDWIGLGAVLRDPLARDWVCRRAGAALVAHRQRWCASPTRVATFGTEGATGVFDSSFFFNATRLLGMDQHNRARSLERFASYYARVDGRRLADGYAQAWRECGLDNTRLERLHDFEGIRVRDLGNILAYLAHHDALAPDDAWRALPPVARFALGATEYAPASKPQPAPRHRAAAKALPRSPGELPLLEQFVDVRQEVAYLLVPGHTGPLPSDGPVYVHRAHAAGHEVPTGVAMIGTVPLPWEVDPTDDATRALQSLARRLVVLSRP